MISIQLQRVLRPRPRRANTLPFVNAWRTFARKASSIVSKRPRKEVLPAVVRQVTWSKTTGFFQSKTRRNYSNARTRSDRERMLESFSFGSYLLLVDYTSRLFRSGQARCGDGVKEIFERLGTRQEFWSDRLKKMLSSKSLHGRFFAGNREAICELAQKCRCRHLANLSPQPAG